MKRAALTTAVAALVALVTTSGDLAQAQSVPDQQDALRRRIERRFEVLPFTNGLVLRVRDGDRRGRLVELADGTVSIDGTPASGAEVRNKLGADADLVLQLSYLEPAVRQRLFSNALPTPERQPELAVPPAPPVPPLPPERPRRTRRGGEDRVRFGGTVVVNEGEVVPGDAVAIGGSVRINGQVTGNVVSIGGRLELGPTADVFGDAVAIGGGIRRAEGARVSGKVVDVGGIDFDFRQLTGGAFPFGRFNPSGLPFFGAARGMFALMSTLARVAVLCVLASIVLLVGREFVEGVGVRAAADPVKAGATGLLAQVLFVPLLLITCLVLIVTIIGIPFLVLIPFAMLALAIVGLVGFTAVAYNVGRFVHQRLAWNEQNPYLTAVTGIVVVVSPVLIARLLGLAGWLFVPVTGTLVFLGLLLEYLAWTVGFGAVALMRFARSRPVVPPAPVVTGA